MVMPTFSVKNFEKFQHYKDRSPPWIKLYNELLDDYEFGLLQDASKFHLVAIWLLASRSENKIPYDPAWVARRINASGSVDLASLAAGGFIVVDQPLRGTEQDASASQAECLSREEGQVQHIEQHITQQSPSDGNVLLFNPPEPPKAKRSKPTAITPEGFDEFWAACPRKTGKADAVKAWPKAVADGTAPATITAGMRRYAVERAGQDAKFTKEPAAWLNGRRWEDEPLPNGSGRGAERANGGFTQFLVNRAEQTNGTVTIDHDDLEFSPR